MHSTDERGAEPNTARQSRRRLLSAAVALSTAGGVASMPLTAAARTISVQGMTGPTGPRGATGATGPVLHGGVGATGAAGAIGTPGVKTKHISVRWPSENPDVPVIWSDVPGLTAEQMATGDDSMPWLITLTVPAGTFTPDTWLRNVMTYSDGIVENMQVGTELFMADGAGGIALGGGSYQPESVWKLTEVQAATRVTGPAWLG